MSTSDPTRRSTGTGSTARPEGAGERTSERTPGRTSPWYWLLLVPVLSLVWPPLYNRSTPQLADIPFFYWYQLAMVFLGVGCTVVVYRMTRRP